MLFYGQVYSVCLNLTVSFTYIYIACFVLSSAGSSFTSFSHPTGTIPTTASNTNSVTIQNVNTGKYNCINYVHDNIMIINGMKVVCKVLEKPVR